MREVIPWWGRIGVKLILSRLPAGYGFWRGIRLFRHGEMCDPAYALSVFREHFARASIPAGRDFVALELGPGDSLASAVIAAAHGATRTHLVDAGRYASSDLRVYRRLCAYLRAQGLRPPDLEGISDVESLLRVCHATYGTAGLKSLREIASESVDFVWSHAVLEHVRRNQCAEFIKETRRVMHRRGVCSHQVDLQDHLGGALNNLRIPSRWWETEWMANSGFYTNRLQMSDFIRIFEAAGFRVQIVATSRWEELPTSVRAFASEFRNRNLADLMVKGFVVSLSPA